VVERQFGGRGFFSAILAAVFVAGEEVAAVEFDLVAGQTVVKEQANNLGNGDIEIDGRNPVVRVQLEISFEPADLTPALKVIVVKRILLGRNDLCKLPEEQRKGPLCPNDADGHIVLVQNEHITAETVITFHRSHKKI